MLLESSRFEGSTSHSYFFFDPSTILAIDTMDEVPKLFADAERLLADGFYLAGYVGYECGYYFEPTLRGLRPFPTYPMAWLGAYRQPMVFDHSTGAFDPPLEVGSDKIKKEFKISDCSLQISETEYSAKIARIRTYIEEGDTYQVNFTDKYSFRFEGSPVECFSALRQKQRVGYSAYVDAGGKQFLSFSPELFFKIKGNTVTTKPMKGTARRGKNSSDDAAIARFLQNDEKNRSENLMILDLLRNDIGRVAKTGSVSVRDMYEVERYETLFQMTSTVDGTIKDGLSLYDVFGSLFPSGSVTGAPKIHTMQIIHELESKPRGIYTGAIGFFSPSKEAVFNVAIRTLVIDGNQGEMGVGSGIVFDSDAKQEFEECKLKAEFLTSPIEEFSLIETILWEKGYPLLKYHLDRLRDSADYFGFPYDEHKILKELKTTEFSLSASSRHRVRLLLNNEGEMNIQRQLVNSPSSSAKIILSPQRTSSLNRFLYHKTTKRVLYESELKKASHAGFEDVIFRNERDEVTEGAISNIFVERAGKLFTPPIECGLLAGVYRRKILEENPRASEHKLTLEDLLNADAIYICNALRGFRKVAFTA